MEVKHRRIFEGFRYYLESLLYVRPLKRIMTRFIKRVLMQTSMEWSPWNVFMVFNRDVGALLTDASAHYDYAWRYKGEERVLNLLRVFVECAETWCFC
jgi:hypothetical protein